MTKNCMLCSNVGGLEVYILCASLLVKLLLFVTSALHISHSNKGCTSVLCTCLKCIFLYLESFDFIRSYKIVTS